MEAVETKPKAVRNTLRTRLKAKGAGRPSILTEDLIFQIRSLYLDGKEIGEICEKLGFTRNTWDTWMFRDTQGLRTEVQNWKYERFIRSAEKFSEELMKDKADTHQLKAIKQREAEFLRETLAKDRYSKRDNNSSIQVIPITLNISELKPGETPLFASESHETLPQP